MKMMTWRESAGVGNLWEVSRKGPTRGLVCRAPVTNEGSTCLSLQCLSGRGMRLDCLQMRTSGNLTPGEDPWGKTAVVRMWLGLLS